MATRSWKCGCGRTVESSGGSDTSCPGCGQEFNAFGQRLRPGWRDNPSNYDDDIGDLEGFELAALRREGHDG